MCKISQAQTWKPAHRTVWSHHQNSYRASAIASNGLKEARFPRLIDKEAERNLGTKGYVRSRL